MPCIFLLIQILGYPSIYSQTLNNQMPRLCPAILVGSDDLHLTSSECDLSLDSLPILHAKTSLQISILQKERLVTERMYKKLNRLSKLQCEKQ